MNKKYDKKKMLSITLGTLLLVGSFPTTTFALDGVTTGVPINVYRDKIVRQNELEISEPIKMNRVGSPSPSIDDFLNEPDLDAKIAELTKNIENKKTDISKAQERISKGVLAFFEWAKDKNPAYQEDIEIATKIINTWIEKGDVKLEGQGSEYDAAAYKNFLLSAGYLEEQNLLRVNDEHFDCEKQKTNFSILAKAIVSANRSTDPSLGHRRTFRVGENLAWGHNPNSPIEEFRDPFNSWYHDEKLMWEFQQKFIKDYKKDHPDATDEEVEAKEKEAREALKGTEYNGKYITNTQVGHYVNMLSPYEIAAIAMNSNDKANEYGVTHAMNAGYIYGGLAISEEEYRSLIEDYKKVTNKDFLQEELQNLESQLNVAKQAKVEKDAQEAADKAIKALEDKNGAVTDTEIADAQALINKVTVNDKKEAFNKRLNDVRAAKAEKDAEDLADKALKDLEAKNGAVTDKEIEEVQAKINKVTDSVKKEEFNNRLDGVKAAKADKEAQDKADKAIKDLEAKNGNVTDKEINDAQALVDQVKDDAKKQTLNDRLDGVRKAKADKEAAERAALEAATELVEKAEQDKTQDSYNKAKEKVEGLNPSEGKTGLETRLVEVEKYIQADNEVKTLEAKNGNVTNEDIQAAQDKVNKLTNETNKKALNDRLDKVREAKADKEAQDIADKAIKALEAKSGNVTDTEIADAQAKVDKVKDLTAKQSLNSRLDNVRQAKSDREAAEREAINEATALVEKAETQQTEEAYTAAKEKVEALNPSGAKTELEDRLVEVDKVIKADKALKVLEEKNISDVTAKELTDAEKLVNDVKAEWKEEFNRRLTDLKNKKAEDDRRKEEEAKKLADAKKEATNKINELENLSQAEKTNHINKVNASNKVEDVNNALLDAQKDNAKKIIAGLNKLKEDEVAKANDDIDKATDVDAINNIVKTAQATQNERQSLDEHKDQAKLKIDPLSKLSDTEKNAYKNRISEATTKDAVDEIVLEAQKDNGKKEIAAMNLLKPEEATKANEDIQNAPDEATIKNIVKEAQDKQDERQILENDKNQAKAKVDALDKLNQEEKDAYKARIDGVESKEDVNAILLEAQKDNAKKTIASLDKLTDDERTQADQDIANAGTEDEIKSIVKEAQDKQKDRQDLEDYKAQANATIDGLDKLEADKKEAYKNRVNEADKKSDIDPIVLEAQKENAKKKVSELTNLNEEEKANAEQAIDNATNPSQIENAVKNAEASNVSLDELKAQAKNKINALSKLSEEEKAAFNEKVDSADTKAKVNEILTEAENANASKQNINPGNPDNNEEDDFPRTGDNDRPINPWRPHRDYSPSWPVYTGTVKPEIKPVPQPEKTVEVKLESKLVIGSKSLVINIGGMNREVVMDVEPYIENNRTMLPIRFLAEALGFKVDWDNASRTVILTDKDNVVKIPVDTNQIIVNGKVFESDVKPSIKKDRTMLPIANIARALGLKDGTDIIWNQNTKEVIISREIVK